MSAIVLIVSAWGFCCALSKVIYISALVTLLFSYISKYFSAIKVFLKIANCQVE